MKPYSHDYNAQPTKTLKNTPILYTNTAIIFELTYDNGMASKLHIDNINTKATRFSVLLALTNTTFEQSKEDITLVYKQYIRFILT